MEFFVGHTFDRDFRAHKTRQVIGWWERRRFFFNKVLLSASIVNCLLMIACGTAGQRWIGVPIGIPDPPTLLPLAILAYTIAANIIYTGGWMTELLRSRYEHGKNMTEFGLGVFRVGIVFTIILTLLPSAICWGALVYQKAMAR